MSKGCEHCNHPLWAGIRCGVCGRWAEEKMEEPEFECPRCGHCCSQSEQEPAAWIEHGLVEAPDGLVWEKGSFGHYTPLYKNPTPCETCQSLARTVMMDQTSHDNHPPRREWQGLTEEERDHIYATTEEFGHEIARAVEAALKEKNK